MIDADRCYYLSEITDTPNEQQRKDRERDPHLVEKCSALSSMAASYAARLRYALNNPEQPNTAIHVEIADCSMIGKPSEKPGFYTVTMQTDPGQMVKLRLGDDARKALRDVLTVGGECESLEIAEQALGGSCPCTLKNCAHCGRDN